MRTFHYLKYLIQRYKVHLGTLVDEPGDRFYIDTVRRQCADAHFAVLSPALARIRSVRGLAEGGPQTLPYFFDTGLKTWVDHILATRPIKRVLVVSSSMAQYVAGKLPPGTRGVLDFIDVDSTKWACYAEATGFPMRWVYAREARTLLRYEREVAGAFDASVFVSQAEAQTFRKLCPEHARRVTYVENGVDADYFSPDRNYPCPFPADEKALVFTGAMNYRANIDAVCWFAREVLPAVSAHDSSVRFYIVGAKPTAAVRALEGIRGVKVIGATPDVRPYLAHAALVVAPLRVARGVQNKVLEALALAKPILATSAAIEGIHCRSPDLIVADAPASLAQRALELIAGPPRINYEGRSCVLEKYDWSRNLNRMVGILEGNLNESQENAAAETDTRVA